MHASTPDNRAIEYNDGMGRRRLQWVQARLGVEPHGKSTSLLVRAAEDWQRRHDLTVDGMIGPKTIASIETAPLPWGDLRVGMWWDLPARLSVAHAATIADNLARDGVDFVVIMLNESHKRAFTPEWRPEQLGAFSRVLASRGVRVGLDLWAYCSRTWVEGVRRSLPLLASALEAPCELIEADIEGPWSPRRLDRDDPAEYPDTQEAADDLAEIMRREAALLGCGVGSTPFRQGVSGPNEARIYAVQEIGGRLTMQCYSEARDSKGCAYDPYSVEGPGREQYVGIRRARELGFDLSNIGVGLAAWDQGSWSDGRSAIEAMDLALLAPFVLGVRTACLWSSKWWWGHKANGYVSEWLRGVKALREAARGSCA